MDGHLKKKEKNWVFFVQGGAFMGAWLSGENGQAANVRKLVLLFLREREFYGAKVKIRFVFPYISKVIIIFSCARFWQAVNFAKLVFWGMLGWRVFWGGGGVPVCCVPLHK